MAFHSYHSAISETHDYRVPFLVVSGTVSGVVAVSGVTGFDVYRMKNDGTVEVVVSGSQKVTEVDGGSMPGLYLYNPDDTDLDQPGALAYRFVASGGVADDTFVTLTVFNRVSFLSV